MPYYIGLGVLSTYPQQRRDRQELLHHEAMRILGCLDERPLLTEHDIARDKGGRPFFSGPGDADFSISHSGSLAAVSLTRGKNSRTSCDVEMLRKRSRAEGIAESFFTYSENQYIISNGRFSITRFYEIWTLKECYLKLHSLSVLDMVRAPSFISSNGAGEPHFEFNGLVSAPLTFSLWELSGGAGEGYIMAAAIEGVLEEAEIRWFTQDPFFCRSIAKIKAPLSPAETVRPKM